MSTSYFEAGRRETSVKLGAEPKTYRAQTKIVEPSVKRQLLNLRSLESLDTGEEPTNRATVKMEVKELRIYTPMKKRSLMLRLNAHHSECDVKVPSKHEGFQAHS